MDDMSFGFREAWALADISKESGDRASKAFDAYSFVQFMAVSDEEREAKTRTIWTRARQGVTGLALIARDGRQVAL